MVVSPPRFHTGSLGAGDTIVGHRQAFMHLCDSQVVQPHSLYEISSRVMGDEHVMVVLRLVVGCDLPPLEMGNHQC